jgi:molybdopterin-guanine dinucleotide biosynthesis protein A
MNISAVLLAGGQSRRMRKDKATLLFRGKPLWQIQLNLLRRLEPHEIFVSARTDPAWRPADVRFVPDDPPSRGPLSGLSASMARIRGDHLIALAIDMPLMEEEYLRSLGDRIEPGRGVLPMIDKRAEPLAAIYPAEAQEDLLAALFGPHFSLQKVARKLVTLGKLEIVQVATAEEAFFLNLNEPGDLDELSLVSRQRMDG